MGSSPWFRDRLKLVIASGAIIIATLFLLVSLSQRKYGLCRHKQGLNTDDFSLVEYSSCVGVVETYFLIEDLNWSEVDEDRMKLALERLNRREGYIEFNANRNLSLLFRAMSDAGFDFERQVLVVQDSHFGDAEVGRPLSAKEVELYDVEDIETIALADRIFALEVSFSLGDDWPPEHQAQLAEIRRRRSNK